MTNTPGSISRFTIENWPPEPEQITEENISRWLDDIAFGVALPESRASNVFHAVRQHYRHNPDLELSEAARYKLMCLHLMVAYAKLEKKLVEILENQAHPPSISLE